MTRLLHWHAYESLKGQVADLIEDYELAYPVDSMGLANRLGLKVQVMEPGSGLHECASPHFEALTAARQVNRSVRFDVYLDPLGVPMRQRFSIVHEIAHVWLGHLTQKTQTHPEQMEGEANFFAQYLLAPDVLVEAWVPDLSVDSIRREFDVSWQTAHLIAARTLRRRRNCKQVLDYDVRIGRSAKRFPVLRSCSTGDVA